MAEVARYPSLFPSTCLGCPPSSRFTPHSPLPKGTPFAGEMAHEGQNPCGSRTDVVGIGGSITSRWRSARGSAGMSRMATGVGGSNDDAHAAARSGRLCDSGPGDPGPDDHLWEYGPLAADPGVPGDPGAGPALA